MDAVAPSVLGVGVLSDPGDDEVYTTGDAIEIGVLFDEAMASHRPAGDHHCGRRSRSQRRVHAQPTAETLVFAYLVRAEDQDDDGIAVEANAVSVGDGTITDAVGNPAGLSHAPLVSQAAHKVAGANLPVTGIHFVSDAGDDDTYALKAIRSVWRWYSAATCPFRVAPKRCVCRSARMGAMRPSRPRKAATCCLHTPLSKAISMTTASRFDQDALALERG